MTAAIAGGLLSSALSARLRAAEQELETLQASATVVRVEDVMRLIPTAVERYRKTVDRLGDVDLGDIERARATIKDLLGEIEVEPRDECLRAKMGLRLQKTA